MTTDGIVTSLEERVKLAAKDVRVVAGGPPSEDAMATAFVERLGSEYRYVAPWHRWLKWDGQR